MVVGKILSLRRWNTSGTSVSRHFDEYDPKDGEHSSIGYVARRRFAWIAAKGPQTDTQYVEQLPLATARKVGVSGVSERA
jgi:hypothetical protein